MDHALHIPSSPAEAIRIQEEMRSLVRIEDDFGDIRIIAGVDVGYDVAANLSKAALVLVDFNTLKPLQAFVATDTTPFPYIPGLLSFREAPVILKALSLLDKPPDLIMVDGQGISHPRRLGIAAHIGVLADLPAIGVAKSVLCGKHEDPAIEKGNTAHLIHKNEMIATVYRSRTAVSPIFISPGHRISHESAVAITAQCLTKYRLPEPTRLADKLSKKGA